MALLKGKLDPKKFNSTTLAVLLRQEIEYYLRSEAGTQALVDIAQQVVETMIAEKIVE